MHLISSAYMSQTRDQQRFTISEVAADWHEPMVPQRSMHVRPERNPQSDLKAFISLKRC